MGEIILPDGAKEIVERRTQHAKVYDCGNGQRQALVWMAPVHQLSVSGLWVPKSEMVSIAEGHELASDVGGHIWGTDATYALALADSDGCDTGANIRVGQQLGYNVYHGYLRFDCTGIKGSDEQVGTVTLKMALKTNDSNTEFEVQIVKGAWTPTLCAVANVTANYLAAGAGTLDVVWRNTTGISLDTYYTSPEMDETYPSFVSGLTYYMLRSGREGTAPTQNELVDIQNIGDIKPPLLLITLNSQSGSLLCF